jgi:chromosome segregation ATPase
MNEIPSDLELQLRGRIALLEEEKQTLMGRNAVLHASLAQAEKDRDKARKGWDLANDEYHEADNDRTNLRIALRESNKQRGIAGDTIHRLRGEAALLRESKQVNVEVELMDIRELPRRIRKQAMEG